MSLIRLGHRDVGCLTPDASVAEAVRTMGERNLGSVVIVEADRPVGILTDRDVVLRVVLRGLDPAGTNLREVMSSPLVTAMDDASSDDAAWRMREHRVRRLPIVDRKGRLLGIVTLDDLLGKVAALRPDVAEMLSAFHAPHQAV